MATFTIHYIKARAQKKDRLSEQDLVKCMRVTLAGGPNAPKRAFTFARLCPEYGPFQPERFVKDRPQARLGDLVRCSKTRKWFKSTADGGLEPVTVSRKAA
jgi:hypothetical protein